ncbi:hypothetical protein COT94_03850 [Candidatus Falkowbacteria bacterium CG10_big_fil_rev_8_21_14_0_10_37_14]|uniref:Type IV secretion system coupling protein TraD DNA-binding domain-containing protein n=1 Tax=Candidatus Falkowbacteria bacterium CG10_big_fil_rev_8_21_14_0_10_37_14 TaxID=1974561 RepID=A0A2M6WSF7_9BACT|nr:type IV secretory system conjugative DNA transfer family protein [Candidatus Falkowbacteria bacterium]PIT95695.1 MAG: hypothetical protein COT94_03850 [Candidatus Falkowbacteria bacterium CG10_big_fil_rev_8_21_14_0_10_37_14]
METYNTIGFESTPLPGGQSALGALLITLGWLFLFFILVLIWRAWLRARHNKQHSQQSIYLVRLPKELEDSNLDLKGKELMHTNVAKAETIISAIGGLRAQRGFKAWLNGRNDHFSLEIVAASGVINFYIITPDYAGEYLEKQIHAHFPDAEVSPVKDYNMFSSRGYVSAGYLLTTRNFALPLKTYRQDEADSLNSIFSVMSKLAPEESMAMQLVVRSAKRWWHRRLTAVVRRAYKTQDLKNSLSYNRWFAVFNFISDTFFGKNQSLPDVHRQLTDMEQQTIKGIEEKNAKAGLDVNLRLVTSSNSIERAERHLSEAIASFGQFNYFEYGNSFINLAIRKHESEIIKDFIHRRFIETQKMILNTEEVASLFHFPLSTIDTPYLAWLPSKTAAAPIEIPSDGLILGYNDYRGDKRDIRIRESDRLRHTYIVGKSGTGKSILMANMAIQDIMNGEGVCVLDPHGDLVDDILARVPASRVNDVVVFAPADVERPLSLNLLEFDHRYPEQKTFVINEMISIFDKLYDLKSTGGPIFEQYMRNAMLLVMSDPNSGATLLDIPRVLSDTDFRQQKLAVCDDAMVVNFWIKEAQVAGGDAALANVVPYITSKLTSFISNDIMRPIIGQTKSSFNLRDIMDERKILLVSLPKGLVGELNSHLLGMIIVGKILMSALSRADSTAAERSPFYLYIDEFQNFTTDSIKQVLSEARKYGLGLTLAHQYIGQLVNKGDAGIKDAVFGNVGTTIAFKVGPEDAEFLEKLFKPEFNATDLVNVDKYSAFVRLLINNMNARPFTMKTTWPLAGTANPATISRIKELSRLKYGVDRQLIEAEVRLRLANF